jgi:hypothetical protein
MGELTFKNGWFGKTDVTEFLKDDDGRNVFLRKLVEKLKNQFDGFDVEIHFNCQLSLSNKRKFLILTEHEYIRPQNYLLTYLNYDAIFGWDLRQKWRGNFHYVSYPHEPELPPDTNQRDIRYSMVCSNRNIIMGSKRSSLYNKRQQVIKYCERKDFNFQLYGSGWEDVDTAPGFMGRIFFELSKRNMISIKRTPKLNSYKGAIDYKMDVLRRSIFNFCYENIEGYDGYVSEKLWDAIGAGCIPVYWPSSDTFQSLVNSELIIDASKFSDERELFKYLESLTSNEIAAWRDSLAAEREYIFKRLSYKKYVDKIVNQINHTLMQKRN